jgi:hypothetical protein
MQKKQRTADERMYDELNEQFFRGRLPKFHVRREKKNAFKQKDSILYFAVGACVRSRRTIFLGKELRGANLRQVLLHEMCHVQGDLRHGRSFRAQLRSLQRQGENWAADEIEFYRLEEKTEFYRKQIKAKWEHALAEDIENCLTADKPLSWLDVRR